MLALRKALGLAMTARSAVVAEIGFVRGRGRVVRAAECVFPDTVPPDDVAGRGKALRQFLRQHHFSASRCVIGLDAKCLAAREKTLPVVPADALAGALAIAAEQEFASDPEDLTCDYVGPVEAPPGQSVLLVAASRRTVDQAATAARAAGLTPVSITPATMALALATRGADAPGRAVLHLSASGVELAWRSTRGFRMVRRLTAPGANGLARQAGADRDWLGLVADEVRRVVALRPGGGESPPLRELLVWDGLGLEAAALKGLGEKVGLAVQVGRPAHDLGLEDRPGAPEDGKFAAAAALALGAFGRPAPAVDFLHSRLAPRERIALGKKILWASAAAAVLLVAAGLLVLDWYGNHQAVASLAGRRASMQTPAAEAKHVLDQVSFARGWYDRRPALLGCLRNLTLAFPAEGRIWATNLAVREDLRVSLSGKAVDEGAVLDVLDRLKASPAFKDVQPLYLRQVGGSSRDVSFAVTLTFVGAE